ncbi:MAG: ThuA domain-containing protein [Planctomycetota bacterium]
MRHVLGLIVCLGVLIGPIATTTAQEGAAGTEPAAKKLRVLVTYGGHKFEEPEMYAMLDELPGIEYDKAEVPKEADLFKPGLEAKYDVILMYDMNPGFSREQQMAFAELLSQGIGLVSWHHNINAHRNWEEWRHIVGGVYIPKDTVIDGVSYTKTPWAHDQKLKVQVVDAKHPITRGVEDFEIEDETYGKYYVSPKSRVLLKTDHPQNNPEICWTNKYHKSRVVFLQLGHDHKAWDHPMFRKLLGQSLTWAAGKKGE